MLTGGVPVTRARPLVIMAGLTVKLVVFTAASWEAMLSWACVSQGLRLVVGFSTESPLAVMALYLASSSGPLWVTSSGPLTSSCKARQYIRRNVGSLYMFCVFGSWPLTEKRFWPGPHEPLFPRTILKSHISREYFVPRAPR